MNLFCKMFGVYVGLLLSCLPFGLTQNQDSDSTTVNNTAKEERMGRTFLSTWPKRGEGLHLLPVNTGIGIGGDVFGARARHASINPQTTDNQQTVASSVEPWILLSNQEQPVERKEMPSQGNESVERFIRQNPNFVQDFVTHIQRTNEQLAQHWAPTLETLQQQTPIVHQMPLLGQALGQSILGSADSVLDFFTRSLGEAEKNEVNTTPSGIQQQNESEQGKLLKEERNPSLFQALFGSPLVQGLQRLTENPSQLTNSFNLNPLFGRNNRNYMETASSDVSDIRVLPNNIVKRTLTYGMADANSQDSKQDVLQEFNLPKSSIKDSKSFLNENKMHKKMNMLEGQLATELKQLQSIVKLANEMKQQAGRNEETNVLYSIPVHKITIEDIKNAVKDPDVMNILKAMKQYRNSVPHKRETSLNLKNDKANAFDYTAGLHNYFVQGINNLKNNNEPISPMESDYIRDRTSKAVLQCHLSETKIPDTMNSGTQIPNQDKTINSNTDKIYYSNIAPSWLRALVNAQNTRKDYQRHSPYRTEQVDPNISMSDLMKNNEFRNWLLSEARHFTGEDHTHSDTDTSLPIQNDMKLKEAINQGTTANIINQTMFESPRMQTEILIAALNNTGMSNNNFQVNTNSTPIEMRVATPQMPQNADKHKGNLFGILPSTAAYNILTQYNSREENPKNFTERTFHRQPPPVINYYYNMPHKDMNSQLIPTFSAENYLKSLNKFHPTKMYPLLYQLNPSLHNQNSKVQFDPLNFLKQYVFPTSYTSTTSSSTGLYGLNYVQDINESPIKVAVGDDQILEMLRQHQTLPNSILTQRMIPEKPQYLTDTATPTTTPIINELYTESQPCKTSPKHSSHSPDNSNVQLFSMISPKSSSSQLSSSQSLPILSPLSSSLLALSSSLSSLSSISSLCSMKPHAMASQIRTIWPFYFLPINPINGVRSVHPPSNYNYNERLKRQNNEMMSSPTLSSSSLSISSTPSSTSTFSLSSYQVLTPAILKRLLQINRDFAKKFPILYRFLMGHIKNDKLMELSVKALTPLAYNNDNDNDNNNNNNSNNAFKEIEYDKGFQIFLEKVLNNQHILEYLIKEQQQQSERQIREDSYKNNNYVSSKEEDFRKMLQQTSEDEDLTFCIKKLIDNERFWQKLDEELKKHKLN